MKTLMLVVAAVACSGCLHTKQVEKGTEGYAQAAEENAEADGKAKPKADEKDKAETAHKAAPATAAKEPAKKATSAAARPPAEEGRPELSVSPSGLMQPNGPALIQQALIKRGYLPAGHGTMILDEETSAAVRKFQSDEDLAKTGAPDRETVRRLGLSVEKVFRNVRDPGPGA